MFFGLGSDHLQELATTLITKSDCEAGGYPIPYYGQVSDNMICSQTGPCKVRKSRFNDNRKISITTDNWPFRGPGECEI